MKNYLYDLAKGSAGITLLEVTQHISFQDIETLGKLLTQIVIAVATVISLFRTKKRKQIPIPEPTKEAHETPSK